MFVTPKADVNFGPLRKFCSELIQRFTQVLEKGAKIASQLNSAIKSFC